MSCWCSELDGHRISAFWAAVVVQCCLGCEVQLAYLNVSEMFGSLQCAAGA